VVPRCHWGSGGWCRGSWAGGDGSCGGVPGGEEGGGDARPHALAGAGLVHLRSVPDASGESLMPFECETAHTSIDGPDRRLEPRLAPRQGLDTDSRCRVRYRPSGSRRENRRPPARRAPQVVSPRTYRDRSAGTRRATLRLRSCCTARARAKRPRVDGLRAAATGPTTVSEVTQGEYRQRHPKMWWSEEQTADPVATIWRKLVVKSLVARGVAKAIG